MKTTIKFLALIATALLMSFAIPNQNLKAEFSAAEKEQILQVLSSTSQLIAESDIPVKKANPTLSQLQQLAQFLNQRIAADTVKVKK